MFTVFQFLVNSDLSFATAVSATTAATESETIAKSLVYIFESHSRALELISTIISAEVEAARNCSSLSLTEIESENVLFRQNSLTTKMFATYAKMVGLEYLWESLSLIINELNDLGSKTLQTTGYKRTEDQASIGASSMEIDPSKGVDLDDVIENALQLQLTTQRIYRAIIKTQKKLPP